jgi:hypothetical protein
MSRLSSGLEAGIGQIFDPASADGPRWSATPEDQAPRVIEDQVADPLTTAMSTAPKSKVVRGFSFFGEQFTRNIFWVSRFQELKSFP